MAGFTNEFKLKGKWWIPNENRTELDGIYGELSYSPADGLELILEGSLFQTTSILNARHNVKIPYLLGIIKERQFVSLFNVLAMEVGQDSWITTELAIEYALFNNEGYFAVPDMEISGINFCINSFSAFFKNYRKGLQLNHQESGISFNYNEVPPLQIVNNGIDVYFFFQYKFKGLGNVADEFSFAEKIYLNIFFDELVAMEKVIGKFSFYRDFFTFFTSAKVSFLATNIFTKNDKGDQIEFALFFKDATYSKARVSALDNLLSFEEIKDKFASLFRHWLENEETIQSGLLLYLQTKFLKFPSNIQTFLNLVFAVETLHNTYFDRKLFTVEESKAFKEQRNITLLHFDEKFKKKVMDCLAHINSMSFNDRLKDLISRQWEFLGDFIYDADDFCRRVKIQRNFLAHNHAEASRAMIQERHYPYFIAMLKLVFECSFLPILGMETNEIKRSIQRHFIFQHYKRILPEIKNEIMS